jgi:hypothetical protein
VPSSLLFAGSKLRDHAFHTQTPVLYLPVLIAHTGHCTVSWRAIRCCGINTVHLCTRTVLLLVQISYPTSNSPCYRVYDLRSNNRHSVRHCQCRSGHRNVRHTSVIPSCLDSFLTLGNPVSLQQPFHRPLLLRLQLYPISSVRRLLQ